VARTTFEPQVYAAQSGHYGSDADGDPADAVLRKPRKRKSPWQLKLLIAFGSLMILFSSGVLAAIYGLGDRYDSKATHADILGGVPHAQKANIKGPLNYLVLGTDSRIADEDGSRSDTMLIVHVDKNLNSAFIVSIPRDSYVQVPAGKGWKGGLNKINAAFAYGGPALTAQTVYNLTHIQMDGAMVINFAGVVDMVNAVGAVHVCPPYDVGNWFKDFPQYKGWKKGSCYDMKGEEAEVFMRQRHLVEGGDFGRMKSQQLVMKALAQKAMSAGIITSPTKLDSLLTTVAKSLTIDKSMNLRDLAFALKGISPSNLTFATVPYIGPLPNTPFGEAVQLNTAEDQTLWQAILNDTTGDWLAAHPQSDVASYSGTGE
jgi:LCP family protein required for cell wall assembly